MEHLLKIMLLGLGIISFNFAGAQTVIIRGRVVDKADGSSIVGASVIEYDREDRVVNGTIINVNGDFALEMKDPADSVRVSFIGYHTLTGPGIPFLFLPC